MTDNRPGLFIDSQRHARRAFAFSSLTLHSEGAVLLRAWAAFLLPIAVLAAGTPNVILLWPKGAPGSEGKTGNEVVRIAQPTGDHVVTSVNRPSITPYLPAADQATGAAVIVGQAAGIGNSG